MRDACDWDLGSALLLKYAETLHKGKFGDWVTGLHEDVVTLLASAQTIHQKTLEDHVEEWLDDLINERPSRDTFRLELISHRIGDLGGGDVIPIVGPPKTGKSSIAMELATDAAKTTKKRHAPIKSLVGQLEMRMDQVARREVAKILGKKSDDVSPEEAKDLKASGRLGHLKHIRMTSRCTTLKSYRAEVSRILAANRDIKLWITDYAECIQKFGDNANRTDESEAIAKMIKELAIAFDVCAILLIQPTKQYSQEGHLGPKPYHAKNSGKWEQDAQAMLFIHSPARFYADMPKEYLELHVLCGRDCEKSVIPLRWSPATFSYDYWSGDVPEPKSQPYDSQGQQGGDDISKWAKKKQRKPTGKQLDMNSSWSSEQDY
jgi:replicative DNA helicase